MRVVIYATGSPILGDVEDSLARAGIAIGAGVRNRAGTSHLSDPRLEIGRDDITTELTALPFMVPLFTPAHRREAAEEARAHGFAQPFSLIDPTAIVSRSAVFEPGVYVGAGTTIAAACRLGAFTFVNRSASIGHHLVADAYVSIGPGAVLAGEVKVGRGAIVAAGAVVLPRISIGANAIVGAGAVVTRDVPARAVVVGNPARIARMAVAGKRGMEEA